MFTFPKYLKVLALPFAYTDGSADHKSIEQFAFVPIFNQKIKEFLKNIFFII